MEGAGVLEHPSISVTLSAKGSGRNAAAGEAA